MSGLENSFFLSLPTPFSCTTRSLIYMSHWPRICYVLKGRWTPLLKSWESRCVLPHLVAFSILLILFILQFKHHIIHPLKFLCQWLLMYFDIYSQVCATSTTVNFGTFSSLEAEALCRVALILLSLPFSQHLTTSISRHVYM